MRPIRHSLRRMCSLRMKKTTGLAGGFLFLVFLYEIELYIMFLNIDNFLLPYSMLI